MSEPRVLTRPLGGSPLAQAVRAGTLPSGWVTSSPDTVDGWRVRTSVIGAELAERNWLTVLAPAFAASGAAAARLERVAAQRGAVVTTGQQPGLFGGPIYTWSKALSALALADELEARTGVATAPVFWAATDDADFREASVTHIAVRDRVETLALAPPPGAGARSMRDLPLGDVGALLQQLETATGSAANAAILDAVRAAYVPGATVGGAYVALLRRVLEPLGIAVLDAAHPAARAAMRPVLARALERASAVDAALHEREQAMRAQGHTPQVPQVPKLSLVFAVVQGERRRIPISAGSETLGQPDADLGPNVLLRPVAERYMLPTVAYLAGPGELAYFAQVSAVAAALELPQPLALPRWSGLILEPHVERILSRLELDIDALRDPHAAEGQLAAALLPGDVRVALESTSRDVIAAIARLTDAVRSRQEELLPQRVVDGAAHQFAHRVERLERRILASVKRRHAELMHQVGVARTSLFPNGAPQERVLNLIPFFARYGEPLLEQMRGRAVEHALSLLRAPSSSAPAAVTAAGEVERH